MVLRWCPCKGNRLMEWCGGVVVVTGSRYREDTGCANPQVSVVVTVFAAAADAVLVALEVHPATIAGNPKA